MNGCKLTICCQGGRRIDDDALSERRPTHVRGSPGGGSTRLRGDGCLQRFTNPMAVRSANDWGDFVAEKSGAINVNSRTDHLNGLAMALRATCLDVS